MTGLQTLKKLQDAQIKLYRTRALLLRQWNWKKTWLEAAEMKSVWHIPSYIFTTKEMLKKN